MNPPDENSGALVVALPAELIRKATDIASVCKEIVTQTAVRIQDKDYVKVEGWMSIATAHGCTASARDVEVVEGGVRAVGEIRRIDNGQVIATAEGFVGKDEPVWFGGVAQTSRGPKTYEKRPDYAIRAMAQTRAISRACRTAFAHVVVMMNAGLSTTPAEEVPMGGFNDAPKSEPRPQSAPAARPATESAGNWRSVVVPKFIKKYAGMTLGEMAEAAEKDLFWWINNYQPKPFGRATSPSAVDLAFRKALDAARVDLTTTPSVKTVTTRYPADDQGDGSDVPY